MPITADELKRYQSGEMSQSEMHRVEKQLLQQPLLSDANDGFEAIKKDKINVENNLSDLKQRLKTRTEKEIVFQPKSTIPRPPFSVFRISAIAASILIFIFAGIYFFNQNTENQAITLNESVKNDKSETQEEASKITENEPITSQQALKKEKIVSNILIEKEEKQDKIDGKIISDEAPPTLAEISEEAPRETAKPLPAPKEEEKIAKSSASEKESEQFDEVSKKSASTAAATARLSVSAITGVVVDEDKKPIEGVAINLKGTSKGTKTNNEGKFYLDGLKKGDILIMNSFNQPSQEIFVRNPLVGTIVYGDEKPMIPNQPTIKIERSPIIEKNKNYTEARPEFGQEAFEIYLKENLRKPQKAIEKSVSGRVTVEFKVDTTGEVSDFRIIKKLGFGCDEEAIRLIKEGQKWFPAQRYGVKEISRKRMQVKF